MIGLGVVMLALLSAPCAGVDEVLDCAEQAGRRLETLRAGFQQQRTYLYFPDEQDAAAGTLLFKKPLLVLRLETPKPKTIWAGKDSVEIYTPSTSQLERWLKSAGAQNARSPVDLTLDKAALMDEYDITLAASSDETWTLSLKPKPGSKAAGDFKDRSIVIRKLDCLPIRYGFTEAAGDKVVMDLSDLEVNEKIKDSEFARNYPKDVEVIPLNDAGLH